MHADALTESPPRWSGPWAMASMPTHPGTLALRHNLPSPCFRTDGGTELYNFYHQKRGGFVGNCLWFLGSNLGSSEGIGRWWCTAMFLLIHPHAIWYPVMTLTKWYQFCIPFTLQQLDIDPGRQGFGRLVSTTKWMIFRVKLWIYQGVYPSRWPATFLAKLWNNVPPSPW
jgi:hypothetical protein